MQTLMIIIGVLAVGLLLFAGWPFILMLMVRLRRSFARRSQTTSDTQQQSAQNEKVLTDEDRQPSFRRHKRRNDIVRLIDALIDFEAQISVALWSVLLVMSVIYAYSSRQVIEGELTGPNFRPAAMILLFLTARTIWRRNTWSIVVRNLGDRGIFFIRVPQERAMSLDKDRSLMKLFISSGQQRYEEFRRWCFEKNMYTIARRPSRTPVYIAGKKIVDYRIGSSKERSTRYKDRKDVEQEYNLVLACRDAIDRFEKDQVSIDELMELDHLKVLYHDIPAGLYDPKYHRKLRSILYEWDDRMYFLLPEGSGGLLPIPPFWMIDIRTYEEVPLSDRDREREEIVEQKIKHSVNLQERVIVFPREKDEKTKGIGETMKIPNQMTGDPTEVAIALTGQVIPIDPEKLAYKVEHPLHAMYVSLIPPIGTVTRSMTLRETIFREAIADERLAIVQGTKSKRSAKESVDRGVLAFLAQSNDLLANAVGQIRPFPKGWTDELADDKKLVLEAYEIFPGGVIPRTDYERSHDNDLDERYKRLFKALKFPEGVYPAMDKSRHILWRNRYTSMETVVGVIFHRIGYFARFKIADLEIADTDTFGKLQKWLQQEFDARGRIAAARALEQEQLLDLSGRALGLETILGKLIAKGVNPSQALEAASYFERMRMLVNLPKNQSLTMFMGEENKPMGEKEQMLFKLLADVPAVLETLKKLADKPTEKKPEGKPEPAK